MRHIRVLLLALCVILVTSWSNAASAYAAEGDGLVVTIASDAPEYKANDVAIFTIEMTNEASTPATDVEYTISLPHGMKARDESSLKATVSEIGPGETVVKTVEAVAYEGTSVGGGQTSGDNNGGNEEETVSQMTDGGNPSKTDEGVPQTGDRSMTVVMAFVVVGLAVATAGFIAKRKKNGAGVLAIVLCFLATGIAFSGVSPAYADEYVSRQADASCHVSVNGFQSDATVSVSYTALKQTGNPGTSGEGGGSVIYEFSDDVLVVDNYQNVEGAYLFTSDQDVAVGDKIAFDNMSDEETLAVGSVTQISQNGDQFLVEIDQATNPEDVFEYIAIDYGTTIDWSDVEFIDGVTVEDMPSTLASRSKYELPEIKISVDEKLGGGGKIAGSITMSNWIDAKFDWSVWNGLKEAKLGFDSSVDMSFKGSAGPKGSGSITLNKKPIKIPLSHGAYIFVNFNLTYSLKGTVEVTATLDANAGVQYKNGKLGTYNDADAEASLIAEAKAKAGIAPAGTLTLLSVELIDAQIEIGPSATAKTTVRDTGLVCSDVDAYLYLGLSSGKNTVWMEAIGLTLSLDIWDENSSPLTWKLHAEDGKLVGECTYDSSSSGSDSDDPVVPDASEFVYDIQKLDDGSEVVHISDYIGDEASIIIPVKIDGKDVVSVGPFEPLSVKQISFEKGSMVEEFTFGYAGVHDTVLTSVDFSNASNMRRVLINDYGTLTSLDLSGLSRLEFAQFHNYNISSAFSGVVLKDNDALTELYIDAYTTDTTPTPDLSEAPHLKALVLHWCGIESIDVKQNPELIFLRCTNNRITHLDTSVLRNLAQSNDGFVLECSRNYIENIDELEALAEELGLSSQWDLTPQYS